MREILLVDDDELLRTMLKLVLARAGYDAREAADGAKALKSYKENPADLVITDIVMPEKEVLELIHDFRRLNPNIKIIAMSGGGRVIQEDYLFVAEKFGAKRTLNKPFSNRELLDAVEELTNSDQWPVFRSKLSSDYAAKHHERGKVP